MSEQALGEFIKKCCDAGKLAQLFKCAKSVVVHLERNHKLTKSRRDLIVKDVVRAYLASSDFCKYSIALFFRIFIEIFLQQNLLLLFTARTTKT